MSATLHIVFGPSGAGKSTYARELARREPAVHFAIDDWMARLFAPDMPEPLEFEWMMARVERCEGQIWSTAAATLLAEGDLRRSGLELARARELLAASAARAPPAAAASGGHRAASFRATPVNRVE